MPQMVRERKEATPTAAAALAFALPSHVPAAVGANIHPSDDPVISAAISALNKAGSDAELMLEGARAAMVDPTRTEAARHVAVKKATEKAADNVVRSMESVRARVASEVVRLEKFLQGPPPVSDAKALGVLLAIQRMSNAERRERTLRAIKAGDEVAAAAVLNASELATGFSSAELNEIRMTWQNSRHPDEARRLATLKEVEHHILVAGQAFMGFWPKLYSRAVVEDAEKRAAKANAMLGAA
jgi:hypothetical protein